MELEDYHAAWRRFCRPSVYEVMKSEEENMPEVSISSYTASGESSVSFSESNSMHPITSFVLNASDEQLEAFDYLKKWMLESGIEFCNSEVCKRKDLENLYEAFRLAGQRLEESSL